MTFDLAWRKLLAIQNYLRPQSARLDLNCPFMLLQVYSWQPHPYEASSLDCWSGLKASAIRADWVACSDLLHGLCMLWPGQDKSWAGIFHACTPAYIMCDAALQTDTLMVMDHSEACNLCFVATRGHGLSH